jgi:hypothetical protein
MRGNLAFIAIIAIAGCATPAQQEVQRMNAADQRGAALIQACAANVERGPDYTALRDKMLPLTDPNSRPTLEQLNDGSKPTAAQIRHLFGLHAAIQECRKIALESVGAVHPAYVTPMAEAYAEDDALMLRLVRGQITWGESARASSELRRAYIAKVYSVNAAINQNLANSHAYEMQRRQQAGQALMTWSLYQQQLNQQQQMINAMSRPVVTTCSYAGRQIYCTSN